MKFITHSLALLLILGLACLTPVVMGEPKSVTGVQGNNNHNMDSQQGQQDNKGQGGAGEEVVNPHEDDVGSLLINTVYSTVTPSSSSASASPSQQQLIPEIEMKKLKAAAKGAGLSEAKADRVLRAVRALDLKYHQVVDLKKVMINPATSADYADRLRRALEDAVVDAHSKQNDDDRRRGGGDEDDKKDDRRRGGGGGGDDDDKKDDRRRGGGGGFDNDDKNRRNADNLTTQQQQHLQPNLSMASKTMTPKVDSDLHNPLGRSLPVVVAVDGAAPPVPLPPTLSLLGGGQSAHHPSFGGGLVPSGAHVFFATPLSAPALSEDLDSLWVLASHILPRKDAFELVQLAYTLKLTRANVFDLQHEFAGGRLTPDGALKLLTQLRARVAGSTTPTGTGGGDADLSKPLDNAALKRLQTVAELSGLDKDTSKRLIRAVVNSGLERGQVHEISDVVQGSGASVEDLNKLLDHLEETDLHTYRKSRALGDKNNASGGVTEDEENFKSTPEQAKGADWIYSNEEEDNNANKDQKKV